MKGEKFRVCAGFGPRLFSLPTKNLRAMPVATIVADQNLAVEMSRRRFYQGQSRLSYTLRWIFESQMRAGGYLLRRNYLLGFVLLLLLCICCQNKQELLENKSEISCTAYRVRDSWLWVRNKYGGRGGVGGKRIHLDASAKSCLSVHIKTQTLRFLLAAYPASLASLNNRNQFCTAQATVLFAIFQDF